MVLDLPEERFEKEKMKIASHLQRRWDKVLRRWECHKKDIELGSTWPQEAHTAELLQSNFFRLLPKMKEIEVEDWEDEGRIKKIILSPEIEPAEQLKKRFAWSKKLKRKLVAATRLSHIAEKEVHILQQQVSRLSVIGSQEALEDFKKEIGYAKAASAARAKVRKSHPYREYVTASGWKIYVGKKDIDNERLTFTFARGEDYWLHAGSYPGSHVILRGRKGEEPDREAVQDALQLALYYSQGRKAESDDVILAKCKYLSKAKGDRPGLVNVGKHKRIFTRLDQSRLNRLFQKMI